MAKLSLSSAEQFELKARRLEARDKKQLEELKKLRREEAMQSSRTNRLNQRVKLLLEYNKRAKTKSRIAKLRRRSLPKVRPRVANQSIGSPYNEGTIIPDTMGIVPLGYLHQEADDAAKLFP